MRTTHASPDAVDRSMTALRKGLPVLITDPLRPERGGIVAIAADRVSDDLINFMTVHAGGAIVAVAITADRAERLGLGLQAPMADDLRRENYTVTVEAREGVSTGISAADRARTCQLLADRGTRPEDIVTPGHVFPCVARERGVMVRPGWAEACVDLARVAGLQPVMTFCHVLDAAGELAGPAALGALADELDVPSIGIAAIVAHRRGSESFVTQLTQTPVSTAHGDFVCRVFLDQLGGKQHIALTLGDVRTREPALVRVHSECLTGDVFSSRRCDCGTQLSASLDRIHEHGRGALLYLRQEGRGIGLVNKVSAYALQDAGRDTVEANLDLGFEADLRDFGLGAQILIALGVQRVRLMTNNPRKVHDLTTHGIEVVSREPLEFEPCEHNISYLRTKKQKLGHLLTRV